MRKAIKNGRQRTCGQPEFNATVREHNEADAFETYLSPYYRAQVLLLYLPFAI